MGGWGWRLPSCCEGGVLPSFAHPPGNDFRQFWPRVFPCCFSLEEGGRRETVLASCVASGVALAAFSLPRSICFRGAAQDL